MTNQTPTVLELPKPAWSLMADAMSKPGWARTYNEMFRAVHLSERIEAAGFSGPIDLDEKDLAVAKKAVGYWLAQGGLPIARSTISLLDALSLDA